MVEVADVHRVESPTAQKPHHCFECHTNINVGERYQRVTTLFDGAWSTMKICKPCWKLGNSFEEWEYGMLSENIRQDYDGFSPSPEVVSYKARYYASLAEGASMKTAKFIMGHFGDEAKNLGFGYRRVAYALQEAAELLHELSETSED